MKQGTPLGQKAKEFVDQGLLYRMKSRTASFASVCGSRLQRRLPAWMDFRARLQQAEALDGMLAEMGRSIDHVVNLKVDRGLLLARLTGRRICKTCGSTYHVMFNPPKQEGICDKCGGELYQRSDDTEAKVGTRLDEYISKTAPLLDYYASKGLLREVDGEKEIDEVTADIV